MKKIKKTISKIISSLADCIVPTLPILIGAGMLKVIVIIFGPTVLNVLKEEMPTYAVLNFVADAGYYFMPIYVGISTAEVFKTNKYMGAFVGGMLLSPQFVELVDSGTKLSFLKISIASTSYGNQVLPSVIAVAIMSYIYNFLNKYVKGNLKALITPLVTILIMIPIAFCEIGPLGVLMSDALVDLIMKLKDLGAIGYGIMCAIIPFITIAGLGGANLSAMLILAASGCDPILFFSNVLYNNILGFVTLALYFKKKDSQTLAAAITSAIGGTSEPAIFGIVMKDIRALSALVIGDFVAGLYAGIMSVKTYAMASFGTFGIITTIGPDSSILHAGIAMVLGCVTGFIICFVTHKSTHE